MEKSKNYQCGSVSYCERKSLMGLCTSKYDCENQLPIEVSLTVPDNTPSFWHRLKEGGVKYWQHGETGICCAVNDNIDLSRRHFEITKERYELHEGAKNTEQPLQPD